MNTRRPSSAVSRKKKLIVGGLIMGLGLLAALLFRRSPGERQPASAQRSEAVTFRPAPSEAAGGASLPGGNRLAGPSAQVGPMGFLSTPWRQAFRQGPHTEPRSGGPSRAAPPELPPSYPEDVAGGGGPGGQESTLTRGATPRKHRIVDGDTLAALAKRYLGSAERGWEIFERNRDVLPSEELLPIGAVLTIPLAEPRESSEKPRQQQPPTDPPAAVAAPKASSAPWRMVPIPPGTFRRGTR